MTQYKAPGIRKIHIVECSNLPADVMLQSMAGMKIAIMAPSRQVEYVGVPELKWESECADGATQQKSNLQFSTLDDLPEGRHLAFVVTCVDGRQYLIGAREGKFPKVEFSHSTGSPAKGAAVRTYKISHTAQKSVLECIL